MLLYTDTNKEYSVPKKEIQSFEIVEIQFAFPIIIPAHDETHALELYRGTVPDAVKTPHSVRSIPTYTYE